MTGAIHLDLYLTGYRSIPVIGLFGFKEIRTTAGIVAGVIEVAAFAALATLALSPAAAHRPAGPMASRSGVLARLQAGVPAARAAAGAVSVAALVLLGIAVAGAR